MSRQKAGPPCLSAAKHVRYIGPNSSRILVTETTLHQRLPYAHDMLGNASEARTFANAMHSPSAFPLTKHEISGKKSEGSCVTSTHLTAIVGGDEHVQRLGRR